MMLTLITNIDFVQLEDGVRINAHALLIQPPRDPMIGPPRAQVRGFGVAGAQPTFSVWLPDEKCDFEIVDANDPTKIFVGDASPEGRPIFSGGMLKVGGREMFLQVSDYKQPICVEEFDAETIEAVWGALPGRVAKFWDAPNMPTLRWVPAESVRQALPV